MKTKTIGELLREEREAHRLPLPELAKRTRIRLEYLQALENNQFELLPAATFVKGYIRSYAQLFGFDHRPLLAILRRDYKESAKGKLIPREFIKPLLRRHRYTSTVSLVMLVVIALFLTVVGYVGWQWRSLQQPPILEVSQPLDQAAVASQVVVEGRTVPEALVTVNGQPVSLQPDGNFRAEIFLANEGVNAITIETVDRRGKQQVVNRTVNVEY
jgi:cytoskeleton protein RodZ